MSFVQLNPTIPLRTSRGGGEAIAVIDYSSEHDLMWVIIDDATGEVWTTPNADVRGFKNYSVGRTLEGAKPDLLDTFIKAHMQQPSAVEKLLHMCLTPEHYKQIIGLMVPGKLHDGPPAGMPDFMSTPQPSSEPSPCGGATATAQQSSQPSHHVPPEQRTEARR